MSLDEAKIVRCSPTVVHDESHKLRQAIESREETERGMTVRYRVSGLYCDLCDRWIGARTIRRM